MQKKTQIQPLQLSRETIRQLGGCNGLFGVAGGAAYTDTQVATGCPVAVTNGRS